MENVWKYASFDALAKVGKTTLYFHSSVTVVEAAPGTAPEGAIEEIPNPIGMLESGLSIAGSPSGYLTISEPMSTPIIRQLKRWESPSKGDTIILDARQVHPVRLWKHSANVILPYWLPNQHP